MSAINTIYQQVTNAGLSYVQGLAVSKGSNTTLSIAVGQARDSTNTFDIVLSSVKTLNAAVNGANGLDTGTFAASTMYAVYLIQDVRNVNPVAVLLSTNFSTPVMPGGYSDYIRIGVWASDGSVHFRDMDQSGTGKLRFYYYDTAVPTAITAGAATSFTAVDLSATVPPLANILVSLIYAFTPGGGRAGDNLFIRPTGSSATGVGGVVTATGPVASQAQVGQLLVMAKLSSSLPKIDYMVTNSGDAVALNVLGFYDNL